MKREEICSAACELFAKNGYYGCSLQEIADAVCLNKATLYNYFKSKDELFLTVLKNEISIYAQAIQKAIDDHSDESLESVLFQIVKAFVDHSNISRLLLWKKTLLMSVSMVDETIRQSSREVLFEMNHQIAQSIRSLLSVKNINMNDPKVIRFINSYYIFIQSVLEWILLNEYIIKKDVSITVNELWYSFWNGSKLD